jgi:hypothetical protein
MRGGLWHDGKLYAAPFYQSIKTKKTPIITIDVF